MKEFNRRDAIKIAGGLAAVGVVGMPSLVRAAFPDRPINVIVPFATGGYNDRLARAFAPYLEKAIGQPIVVMNKPGGATQLGHTYALQQPADGYTIICSSVCPYIPLSILLQNAPYKVDDFHIINIQSRDYTLAATASDSDLKSFKDVIAKLKKDPRSVSIGVQAGGADYLNFMLSMQAAGVDTTKMRIVTYDGGGQNRNAAAGGQVDVGFVGGEGFLGLMEKITPLALFADEKVDWMPSAPLIGDSGLQIAFVEGSQRGWAVSTALVNDKPDIYKVLEAAIEKAAKSPECAKALATQQLSNEWSGPEKSNRVFRDTADRMKKYVDLLK